MTADKVRQLAEQAGIEDATFGLSRFAALVEAATLERAAQECENVPRVRMFSNVHGEHGGDPVDWAQCAAAIRALKQKE